MNDVCVYNSSAGKERERKWNGRECRREWMKCGVLVVTYMVLLGILLGVESDLELTCPLAVTNFVEKKHGTKHP